METEMTPQIQTTLNNVDEEVNGILREVDNSVDNTPKQSKKDKYITIDLATGGEIIIFLHDLTIRSLQHIPAVTANSNTLSKPYPGEDRPETWSVFFQYGDRYNVTEECYNQLKDSISPLISELSALGT